MPPSPFLFRNAESGPTALPRSLGNRGRSRTLPSWPPTCPAGTSLGPVFNPSRGVSGCSRRRPSISQIARVPRVPDSLADGVQCPSVQPDPKCPPPGLTSAAAAALVLPRVPRSQRGPGPSKAEIGMGEGGRSTCHEATPLSGAANHRQP